MFELKAFVDKEFERALQKRANMNEDGTYNVDYIEADCYCAAKKEYGAEFNRPLFFELIDELLLEKFFKERC